MKAKYDPIAEQNKRLEMYAFPSKQMALIGNIEMEVSTQGLTKREYFAAIAMQGVIQHYSTPETVAQISVQMADALLKALEKQW